jgi:aspartyl protease family protein
MRGAPIVLDSVAIGPIDVRNVDASVAESDLQISLLGMSFLSRLSGYQVSGDGLTLKQ